MARVRKSQMERIAASIILEEKITAEQYPLDALLPTVRRYMRCRHVGVLARVICASRSAIDVNGFELPSGRSLLREAASQVVCTEIIRQLTAPSEEVVVVLPKMAVAGAR